MRGSTRTLAGVLTGCLLSHIGSAHADVIAVTIEPAGLPYELSPSNYDNSHSNHANSPSNYANSVSNYSNSPSNYANSSSNYANRPSGDRNIITETGDVIGYYVFNEEGVINFYNYSGVRVAYLPAGGHTQSLHSESGWCGVMGRINGQVFLGLIETCFLSFLLRN